MCTGADSACMITCVCLQGDCVVTGQPHRAHMTSLLTSVSSCCGTCHGLRFLDFEKCHRVCFERCGTYMYCWHGVPASLLLPTTLYSTPCGCSGCGEEQLCHTMVPNGIGAVVVAMNSVSSCSCCSIISSASCSTDG